MNPDRLVKGRSRAFTLAEVMVALAIFAMIAVVLGTSYVNVLHGYAVVSHGTGEDQDVAFARQGLLAQPDLQTAENGDEFDTSGGLGSTQGRHIKWTAAIAPTNTTDLFTVTFTCEITEPITGKTSTVTQTFMLLRPTWSDPTDRTSLRQAAANRIAQLQGRTQ